MAEAARFIFVIVSLALVCIFVWFVGLCIGMIIFSRKKRNNENECKFDGVIAEIINRDELVKWLGTIPLHDLSDGHGTCRVIFEDDFKKAIGTLPHGTIIKASTETKITKGD